MRNLSRVALVGVVLALGMGADAVKPVAELSPVQAVHRLVDGNVRYLMGAMRGAGRDEARRVEVAKGQHPIAAVLSCADSRVPVEVIFDQGLGDIFSVRVAGNVVDVNEMASLEYAVEHLHVPLIVVLGHTKCGAVGAAASDGHLPEHIEKLVGHIKPAVEEAKGAQKGISGDALVAAAVKRNVMLGVKTLLEESEIVRGAVEAKKIQVVGEVYDLETGKVEYIGMHPQQEQVMAAAKVKATKEKVAATEKVAREKGKLVANGVKGTGEVPEGTGHVDAAAGHGH